MSGLLGELVGEGLEVVDVDLASAEAFPLVGLVELPADLPGPDGDCGDQSVDPELESVLLLLLLPLVSLARADGTSSSGNLICT